MAYPRRVVGSHLSHLASFILGYGSTGASDAFAFRVQNTSGGAVSVGAVGYIDEAGEFQTTATAYSDVAWAVALTGGANNDYIYVVRRGRVIVTLNGNCSAGDYLYTSTTAGQAQPQSHVRSELFAVALTANAAGAGGTCEALLLCHTKFYPLFSSNYVILVTSHDDSDFVAAIDDNAGAHGGQGLDATHVPYDTVTFGNENVLNVNAATELGKMRLFNSTRGTYRLVTSLDAANDWIGTVASADAWADNDAITIRSQTCDTGVSPYAIDVDLSQTTEVPETTRSLAVVLGHQDTGAAGEYVSTMPWSAFVSASQMTVYNQVAAAVWVLTQVPIKLVQRRFCWRFGASGAATAGSIVQLAGVWVAEP